MLATMLKASSYGNDSDVGSSMDIIMMLERDSIFNVRVTQVCFDEVLSAEALSQSTVDTGRMNSLLPKYPTNGYTELCL